MNCQYTQMGDTLKLQGNVAAAIPYYDQAFQAQPNSPWTCFNLGKALQQNGQIEAAIGYYQKAIHLQPDFTPVYSPLRHAPLPQNSPLIQILIDQYQQIINLQPDFPLAYINLAAALTQQGKIEAAKPYWQTAAYRQALANHPQRTQVKWNFSTVREPNFIIIGSPRCGTTSLYKYMISHPQILPCAEKEVRFFSQEFHHGMSWYLSHFMPQSEGEFFLTGEATPTYLNHPQAAARVYQHFPNIKLILILRNPVNRTISHYQMQVRRGTENRSFTAAIESELAKLAEATETQLAQGDYWQECPYLDKSLYYYSIKRWMKFFAPEQFLILRSEDLYADPAASLQRVFTFLGLPDSPLNQYPPYNAAAYPPVDDDSYYQLEEYFKPHHQKLAVYSADIDKEIEEL